MERLVVACIQQRMHLPETVDAYCEDLRRFLRVAVAKQARLVVFPELGGVMLASPLLADYRSTLLKRADRGRRRNATVWQRFTGSVAGALAGALKADFRHGLGGLLDVAAAEVWQTYVRVFGGLAHEFGVVLVAPSAYLPDPADGVVRNLSAVFSSSGALLGCQTKVVLHPEDVDLAQPGSTWNVIPTEVGGLGLILGSDVLFPEVGRLLAYQGADAFVCQSACMDVTLYNKIRAGALARMQDNQVFTAASFLVGENRLSRGLRTPFVGKSAVFAPQELTPRTTGVLVEMGNPRSEGVLAATWDFPALRELWESSDTPVRHKLPLAQAGQLLAPLYAKLQALPGVLSLAQLTATGEPGGESAADAVALDDLPVVGSVTTRWPLVQKPRPEGDAGGEVTLVEVVEVEALDQEFAVEDDDQAASRPGLEDETDEMDIVGRSGEGRT